MKKKFAIVFLSLCLVFSLPFAAHANIVTATGRYLITAVKHVTGGAKVTATNTATGAKHVATHGVSAPALGFAIGAGLVTMGTSTGVGLAFQALTGLALDAVDWVLDPANNSVNYQTQAIPDGAPEGYFYRYADGNFKEYATLGAAGNVVCKFFNPSAVFVSEQSRTDSQVLVNCSVGVQRPTVHLIKKPLSHSSAGNSPAVPQKKSIPINTLAQKTLELADAGNAAAQKDVETHVAHKAQNGDLDNELDNATDITEPENPVEPAECPSGYVKLDNVCVKIPDSEIEPPAEGEEPLFCDSSEFTKKVCDWIDWTQTEQDELEPDAGKVDIIDKSEDLSIDNDRIDFSNQCPAPTPINTSVGGFPVSTELNYQPLCDFFTMLNPFVVGMGGISSALIIAGGARRG